MVKINGIDVSVYQGKVDYAKVKAAGNDFVIIRIGWAGWDGGITEDKNFRINMANAINAGLNVGVYVYSYCRTTTAANNAANNVLSMLEGYKVTYPIAFDIEDTTDTGTRYDKMGKDVNTAICKAFLDTIEGAGYFGMLYTYKWFATAYLNMAQLTRYALWIAEYNGKTAPTYNLTNYAMWQYTGSGEVPGIDGDVDRNYSYIDFAKVIYEAGLNNLENEEIEKPEIPEVDYKSMYENAMGKINQVLDILQADN